jgi:hypothetical protein
MLYLFHNKNKNTKKPNQQDKNIVKGEIAEPEETTVARERLGKHASAACEIGASQRGQAWNTEAEEW